MSSASSSITSSVLGCVSFSFSLKTAFPILSTFSSLSLFSSSLYSYLSGSVFTFCIFLSFLSSIISSSDFPEKSITFNPSFEYTTFSFGTSFLGANNPKNPPDFLLYNLSSLISPFSAYLSCDVFCTYLGGS